MDKWLIYLKTINMIGKMFKPKDKIVILDSETSSVVILENIPEQEAINNHYDGNWELWLYDISKDRDDMPNILNCNWQWITGKNSIETIKL